MATPSANCRFRILRVSVTGSTNADLLARAAAGEPAGLVLVAGHQTLGRGRLGRRWEAPPDVNLLASVLVRPTGPPATWFRAAMAVAVAAVDALRELGVDAGIKWPNDLVVGDDKLAGILAESDGAGAVVVGIGCNVGWPAAGEYPGGTSLAALGVEISPDSLLDRILDRVDLDAVDLLDRYRARCATTGREILVHLPDGAEVAGRALAVDDEGHLVVEVASPPDAAGGPVFVTRRFAVGDVVHARRR